MSKNVEVVRRLFAAVEQRDLSGMLECYHEEVEIHEAASLPYGGVYRGLEGAVRHASGFQETWGRFQPTADHALGGVFSEGDDGAIVAIFRHRAVDPARGLRLDEAEVGVYRMRDDKIVHSQMLHFDTAALLRFLDGSRR